MCSYSTPWIDLLPPAYVVRREGNSFILFVSSHLGGGYPYPIMLCNISQNAMGQPGGVPCQVQPGGVPWPGGYPARYSWGGVKWPGGIPWWGKNSVSDNIGSTCYTAGGMPTCVHAGGLSCQWLFSSESSLPSRYPFISLIVECHGGVFF